MHGRNCNPTWSQWTYMSVSRRVATAYLAQTREKAGRCYVCCMMCFTLMFYYVNGNHTLFVSGEQNYDYFNNELINQNSPGACGHPLALRGTCSRIVRR